LSAFEFVFAAEISFLSESRPQWLLQMIEHPGEAITSFVEVLSSALNEVLEEVEVVVTERENPFASTTISSLQNGNSRQQWALL
jgi:hypothetical protein